MNFYKIPKNRVEALEALARSYNLVKSVNWISDVQPLLDAIVNEAALIKAEQEKEVNQV